MYLFSFLIFCGLFPTTHAFFAEDSLIRVEKKITVDTSETQTHLTILETISNRSSEAQSFQVFESLPSDASNIEFFVDARGENYEILENKSMLELLFEKAKIFKDYRFFKLANGGKNKLMVSSPITISAEEKIHVKTSFTAIPQKMDSFYYLSILPPDEILSGITELSVNIESVNTISHFFSTLGNPGYIDKTNNRITYLVGQVDRTPTFDTKIFWTSEDNPVLSGSIYENNYFAHFPTSLPKKNVEEITFLVDISGSVYGPPWDRMEKYINFLLEHFPVDQKIRIALFNNDVLFFIENFEKNSLEFRKDTADFLRSITPKGKSDIKNALSAIKDGWSSPKEKRITFLISDFESEPELKIFEDMPYSLIALDISLHQRKIPEIIATKSGGFYQKLFRTPWQLVESEEILNKWNYLKGEFLSNNLHSIQENEQDILPAKIDSFSSLLDPVFIGRTPTASHVHSPPDFLSRIWAARKIAVLLNTQDFSQDNTLDALLAIGRTFGIKTFFFDENTTRTQLNETLNEVPPEILEKEIFKLNSPIISPPETNAKFVKGIPFYYAPAENTWRHFNFFDRVKPETYLQIAPFSEAQRKLFVEFPEILGNEFGVGNQVEFCTLFRCVSVKKGNRDTPLPSDRTFFRDFDANHWANQYLIKLVNAQILIPESNGKLHPNRPIDRGTFVKMLVEHLWGKDFQPPISGITFPDIADTNFFDAVNFLVQKNVIKGYPDGTFRPYQSLTRAEAVKILLAANKYRPPNTIQTPIFFDSTGWELPWVNEAQRRGIVRGFPDGTFRPHHELTRAEGVKLIVEAGK